MSGYTKGPWMRSGKTVYALNPRNFNRFCAQVQDAHAPDDELIANAVLMTAAPDLLEALDGLLFAYQDPGNEGGAHDDKVIAARAAIARARGEA